MKNYKICLFIVYIVVLNSCKKLNEIVPNYNSIDNKLIKINSNIQNSEYLVLGKKLENPSTIEKMEKAYQNVISNSKAKLNVNKSPVRVTHLYIQYRPKDWEEYDKIKNENNKILDLYDYPLDREILVNGNKYQDPEVPNGKPTYQYAVVEKNYNFNKEVKFKILSELYLPEFDETLSSDNNGKISAENLTFIENWIKESLILTKNQNFISKKDKFAKLNWTPTGKIQIWDTRINGYIPLEGVKVKARRLFTTYWSYTQSDGNYNMAPFSFTFSANYSIFFETPIFDVREATFGQAWISGPFLDQPWNYNINFNNKERFHGHVFRAAFEYNYGDSGGLLRPWKFSGNPIKYSAMDSEGSVILGDLQGVNTGNWSIGLLPSIYVYRFSNGTSEYSSDAIFSTTIHETAHLSHWRLMEFGGFSMASVMPIIRESWATAVELEITKKEYKSKGISNFGEQNFFGSNDLFAAQPLRYGYQGWRKSDSDPIYTNLFIDIVDNYNQNGYHNFGFGIEYIGHNDLISGLNLAGVETTFLNNTYNLQGLFINLLNNNPNGNSHNQIVDFISLY